MVAVGVLIATFFALSCAILPEAYLTVPIAHFNANLLADLFLGSYTKSSITSLELSVTLTCVSSSNDIPTSPFPVSTVSILSILVDFFASIIVFSRVIEALPFCSVIEPILAIQLVLNDTNSSIATGKINDDTIRIRGSILCHSNDIIATNI